MLETIYFYSVRLLGVIPAAGFVYGVVDVIFHITPPVDGDGDPYLSNGRLPGDW